MKGIIIAGGLGTRLRPLTDIRPKPLVPLANRPFLEYQVALLKQHGIDDVVFATNYMADRIEAHFGDGSRFGVRMRYAMEETPLGTGGAIRNAASHFPDQTVAVFNGDILTDFDLSSIVRFHDTRRADATITLAPIRRPHPFGVLSLDEHGCVSDWHEPTEEEKAASALSAAQEPSGEDLINAGFYILSPGAIDQIPHGQRSSIEREIYPKLIRQGRVFGFAPSGFWMDVGRPSHLLEANLALLAGSVRTRLSPAPVSTDAQIASDASVSVDSSIGPGCSIGSGARIERSILMTGVSVGRNAVLCDVIVDEGTRIGDNVVLQPGTGSVDVIAAGSVITV